MSFTPKSLIAAIQEGQGRDNPKGQKEKSV